MPKGIYERVVRECSIPGCGRRHYGHSYCQLHHRRWKTNGDPLNARRYATPCCQIPGCGRPHHSDGLCCAHAHRERRHGDPLAGRTRNVGPILSRIMARVEVDPDTECWNWTGATGGSNHYGSIGFEGRTRRVHILTYALLVGDVPDGLVLDHTCERPICCNPEHLEPVTQAENLRRGREGRTA